MARHGSGPRTEFVGAPTGIMDQSASLRGRPDGAVYLDCRDPVTEPVPLGLARPGCAAW